MPLSEEEQRILQEIEAQFYAEDPKLAREVSRSGYSRIGRRLKWSILGVVVGLVLMIILFTRSVWLGAIGFALAFACGVSTIGAFRQMTRAGLNDLRRRQRSWLRDILGSDRMKRRWGRSGDE